MVCWDLVAASFFLDFTITESLAKSETVATVSSREENKTLIYLILIDVFKYQIKINCETLWFVGT